VVRLEPTKAADAPKLEEGARALLSDLGLALLLAPDVAVEVLSPSDASTAVQQKMHEYLTSGAKLVWVVDPALRSVTVYRADGSARVLRSGDTLEGEDVLVGFSVRLAELFD